MSASGASEAFVPQAASASVSGHGTGQQHVIVVGGGVIGCCTAYYLGKLGVKVTVVEKTEIACAASGKAGGFLALDWCDGSAVQGLARASFALHEQLANELDGKGYGYRRVDSLSVSVEEPRSPQHSIERAPQAGTPAWIDGSIKGAVLHMPL
jgi:glycine/D-amino acid oxidase-like deaminating enzyme